MYINEALNEADNRIMISIRLAFESSTLIQISQRNFSTALRSLMSTY